MKFIPQWAWVLLNLWYVHSPTRRHVIKNTSQKCDIYSYNYLYSYSFIVEILVVRYFKIQEIIEIFVHVIRVTIIENHGCLIFIWGKFSFDWHIWNWLSFHLNSFNLWMQNLSQVYLYSNISGNAKITKILLSFWRET
jgi:hypothetical protein